MGAFLAGRRGLARPEKLDNPARAGCDYDEGGERLIVAPRLGMGLAAALLLLPARECGEGKVPRSASAPGPAVSTATPAPAPAALSGPDVFGASARPVLLNRCAPCHEPGGQMYGRLPFDDASVVAAHPEGVLKRLKDADREAVEKWLASLPEKPKG